MFLEVSFVTLSTVLHCLSFHRTSKTAALECCAIVAHVHLPGSTKATAITDVAYVADEAIFITGTDNDSLVNNIKQVANMVDKTMSSHGMAVNWDPSKTEVIMLWAGKRTRACKNECNVEEVPGVSLENGRVRFVQQPKHLGSMVSATPSPAMEFRERIKKATRAFHALARKVFLQHETDIHLRTRFFQCSCCIDPPLQLRDLGAYTRAGAMETHLLPQVLAKDGQISQSARSWQGTSLRCRSVGKDEDAECLLCHRIMPCQLCNVIVLLSTGPSARPLVCP